MKLLILGATGLTGTATTLEALDRGHHVVAVHRGRTDTLPDLDTDRLVEVLHDRVDGHAALLPYGPFDAVVDVAGRLPAWVADAVRALDGGSPWWVQLSSVSAYADQSRPGPTESDPVATYDDPVLELRACTDSTAELSMDYYGPNKAAAERLLLEAAARQPRSTVLRLGLITGAHDWSWRVPWWVKRIADGGATIAPPAGAPTQVIDSRDIARITLDAIEQRIAGVYNTAPAPGSQDIGMLVEAARAAVAAAGLEPATVTHVTRELLAAHEVEPWSDMPAWIPDDIGFSAMVTARTDLLQEVFGFEPRPLQETMAWVLDWIRSGSAGAPSAGLDAEREQRILAAC